MLTFGMLVLSSADFSKFVFMKTFRVSNSLDPGYRTIIQFYHSALSVLTWIQFKLFTKAIGFQDKQHDTHSASKIKKIHILEYNYLFLVAFEVNIRFNNFSVMSGRVLSS